MSDSSKKIIRGETIDTVTFCHPETGASQQNSRESVEEESFELGLEEGRRQGFEAGRAEGREQGFSSGYEKARQELKTAAELLEKIGADFVEKQQHFIEAAKPELLHLSLAVCENILKQELKKAEIFFLLVEKTVEQSKNALKDNPPLIFLSFSDYEKFQSHWQSLQHLQFKPDPTLSSGHFRLDTSFGPLHYDVQKALREIESIL